MFWVQVISSEAYVILPTRSSRATKMASIFTGIRQYRTCWNVGCSGDSGIVPRRSGALSARAKESNMQARFPAAANLATDFPARVKRPPLRTETGGRCRVYSVIPTNRLGFKITRESSPRYGSMGFVSGNASMVVPGVQSPSKRNT